MRGDPQAAGEGPGEEVGAGAASVTEIYTASRLRVLRECPRKHHLRYRLGLLTAATAEMRFGTVGHAALEAYYRAWQAGDLDGRLDAALALADQLPPFDRVKLRLLVIAYHERWGGEDWEILAVEVEFRYELADYLIGGKIDALIRSRADGRVYVVEHKFTGSDTSLGGPYWERLALDTQVSIYIDGAAMLGHEIAGCIYDVIKRPEHEQLQATPPEARRYTVGKGCKACGGSAKAGAVARGCGFLRVAFASSVETPTCDGCAGSGWKLDKDGKPEAPRLHATQREHDETIEDFEDRLLEVIAERPDDFLQRGPIVRLGDELPAMRIDLVEWIEIERTGLAPRNDSACARGHRLCDFFPICAHGADPNSFNRGPVHPELEAAA
jgi:hypothetical protein